MPDRSMFYVIVECIQLWLMLCTLCKLLFTWAEKYSVFSLSTLMKRARENDAMSCSVGNPPQGNQQLLVVKDKVGRLPGELGVNKSMECDLFPSVLWHCWLGDRNGIRPFKKLDVGLLVVMVWLELCTTYSSSSLLVTTTSIILCFNKHRLTQVYLENGCLKPREREREREFCCHPVYVDDRNRSEREWSCYHWNMQRPALTWQKQVTWCWWTQWQACMTRLSLWNSRRLDEHTASVKTNRSLLVDCLV